MDNNAHREQVAAAMHHHIELARHPEVEHLSQAAWSAVATMAYDDDAPLPTRLAALDAHASATRGMVTELIRTARAAELTWQAIGDALGITRQSAWEQFRHLDP